MPGCKASEIPRSAGVLLSVRRATRERRRRVYLKHLRCFPVRKMFGHECASLWDAPPVNSQPQNKKAMGPFPRLSYIQSAMGDLPHPQPLMSIRGPRGQGPVALPPPAERVNCEKPVHNRYLSAHYHRLFPLSSPSRTGLPPSCKPIGVSFSGFRQGPPQLPPQRQNVRMGLFY